MRLHGLIKSLIRSGLYCEAWRFFQNDYSLFRWPQLIYRFACVPTDWRSDAVKSTFYKQLQDLLCKARQNDSVILDLNARRSRLHSIVRPTLIPVTQVNGAISGFLEFETFLLYHSPTCLLAVGPPVSPSFLDSLCSGLANYGVHSTSALQTTYNLLHK